MQIFTVEDWRRVWGFGNYDGIGVLAGRWVMVGTAGDLGAACEIRMCENNELAGRLLACVAFRSQWLVDKIT